MSAKTAMTRMMQVKTKMLERQKRLNCEFVWSQENVDRSEYSPTRPVGSKPQVWILHFALRASFRMTQGAGNAHIVYNKFREIDIFFRKNANLSLFDIAGIYI